MIVFCFFMGVGLFFGGMAVDYGALATGGLVMAVLAIFCGYERPLYVRRHHASVDLELYGRTRLPHDDDRRAA